MRDRIGKRYLAQRTRKALEIWKFNRQMDSVAPGTTLRVLAQVPFRLRWTTDEWQHVEDQPARATSIELSFVDIPIAPEQRTNSLHFLLDRESTVGRTELRCHDSRPLQHRRAECNWFSGNKGTSALNRLPAIASERRWRRKAGKGRDV